MAVGIGAIIATLTGSYVPLYVAAIITLMLTLIYEFTLRSNDA